MKTSTILIIVAALLLLIACDRRRLIPTASEPSACTPQDLGSADELYKRTDLPIDHVVTFEASPHHLFFGWVEGGKNRSISKLLGTERKLFLYQEFTGEAPPTTVKYTGILRRYADLPGNPFEAAKANIKNQFGWEVPNDAYILLEGFRPEGCRNESLEGAR